MRRRKLERELKRRLGKINYKGDDFRRPCPPLGFDLKEPCKSCPFRSDVEPYYFQLIEKHLLDLSEGNASFTCHETDPRSDYKGKFREGGVQHCAGAAIFVENCGTWTPAMSRAFFEKRWDNLAMSRAVPVYGSLVELLRAYGDALARGKRNKYFPGSADDEKTPA